MSIPAGMSKALHGHRPPLGDKNVVVISQLTSYLVVKINEVSQEFQWGSFCHICQLPPLFMAPRCLPPCVHEIICSNYM